MKEIKNLNVIPASIWRRIFASMVDSFISIGFFLLVIGMLILFSALYDSESLKWLSVDGFLLFIYGFLFVVLLILLYSLLYFAFFESSKWQATPGKKLLGLKVQSVHGQRISFGRAMLRTVWYVVPYIRIGDILGLLMPNFIGATTANVIDLVIILGFLGPIFFTKDKTTLYDILSNTRVVQQQRA